MKLRALSTKGGMSRREFLKVIRLKTHGIPVIDKKRCTGCGLCALDCETKALVVNQVSGKQTYQLLFREEACNACRICQEVCPEHCLQWMETEPEKHAGEGVNPSTLPLGRGLRVDPERCEGQLSNKRIGAAEGVKVIFEDEMSRCDQCGIPLFPRSMVERLEPKIRMNNEASWPLSLCPSCRIKTEFGKAMAGRAKD